MGELTALVILAEVGDFTRFADARKRACPALSTEAPFHADHQVSGAPCMTSDVEDGYRLGR